jgi:transcriptional regulator with XRE-family HTH domain
MTPAQCRSARGLLGLSQTELAELAGIKRSAVADYEADRAIRSALIEKIERALVAKGIEFASGKRSTGVLLKWCLFWLHVTTALQQTS